MPLMSREEMDSCRKSEETSFDREAQIYRAMQARDSGGGMSVEFAAVGRPICCRLWNGISARDIREQVVAGKIMPVTEWKAAFAWDADVRADDRIVVDGDSFDVIGTDRDKSSATCLVALLRKTLNGC